LRKALRSFTKAPNRGRAMADDEAEHSKVTAEPDFTPGSPHEMPVSGTENQSHGEPEATEAKSQPILETTAAQPVEAEPSGTDLPGAEAHGEGQTPEVVQVPVDAGEPETAGAPELASLPPEGAFANVPEPASEQTKPRSRLFPAFAATAIAGGILGFGGTFALRHFEGSQNSSVASDERIAALTARIDAIEGKDDAASTDSRTALAALETRVAAAKSAANKAADSANLAEADLQKDIASRPAAQEPVAGSTPPEAPDFGPLTARIGATEQKLASLESALAAPKAELRARQQDRENAAAGPGDRAQAIAIVAESLLLKLDSDGQFSGELTALENLGVPADSLAPLRAVSASPVLSERQLTAQFAALAPAVIASDPANQASADEGFLDRVTRHAKGLVHVRRVGEAEDTDIEGLVARIEKALADHDLEAAYKAWKELPSPATKVSEGWGEAAKTRLDAINAARSIEADAVAVLGKPKS
jgi:hypothetical protein